VARKPGQVRALFTQPAGVFKCGGAPQKILYLAADHLRRTGKLPQAEVQFFHPGQIIFGVPEFAKTLNQVVDRYGIQTHFGTSWWRSGETGRRPSSGSRPRTGPHRIGWSPSTCST
jgi:hypothetical protein